MLLLSIGFNVLCIMPYAGSYIERIKEHFSPTKYFAEQSSDKDVIAAVVNKSMEMDGTAFSCEQPKRGLVYDIGMFLHPSNKVERYNDCALSFLYWGLSEYAMTYKDKKVIDLLEQKVQAFTESGKLTYQLKEVDQVPIGNCFLNLYKSTKKEAYLSHASQIYEWLLKKREPESNIIFYRKNCPNQFVDGLGMIIPFLVNYSKVTGDSLAYQIALDNMKEYYRYGVDKETGFPAHGYSKSTHIKLGSINWGRGIGWYVIAAAYLPEFKDKELDKHLPAIGYSQFPLSSGTFDSSAALMYELYLQSRGIHSASINFIKPYITIEGLVANCSGDTYDFNNHSRIFSPAELTNGLFLILLSNIAKSNYK